jgi:hypothetical protein
MKKDMIAALEKIKPGEGKMEEVRKNANATNVTNKTRKNTNATNTKNANTNKTNTKKGPQKVCIRKARGVKCYLVENKNGEMTIEPIPG